MHPTVARLGFFAALASFAASAGYVVVQALQVLGALTTPLDDILIYGFSLAIAPPFLVAIAALHAATPADRRVWTQIAMLFGAMYATYVALVYAVQLASVIPATLRGAADRSLTVYPQSMFWIVDGLGYVCLGAATAFAAFALPKSGAGLWARRLMLANGCITPLIVFAYVYPHFSIWVLMVGSPWVMTAPGSLLALAVYFRRGLSQGV